MNKKEDKKYEVLKFDISAALKNAREKKGLSQKTVAEKTAVSRQSVSKWEHGKSRPDKQTIQLLSQLYEVPVEELIGSSELSTPKKDSKKPDESSEKTFPSEIEGPFWWLVSLAAMFLPGFGILIGIIVLYGTRKLQSYWKYIIFATSILSILNSANSLYQMIIDWLNYRL